MSKTTKKEVLQRIKGLDPETKKLMVCALVGHSRIVTHFFGYWYCGRCGVVLVGHNGETCHENAKALTWRDKLLVPVPLQAEDGSHG